MKHILLILALVIVIAPTNASVDKLPISIWTPPRPLNEEAVKTVAEGNFNLYFDYFDTTPEMQKDILNWAEKYGIGVKIYDNRLIDADWTKPDFKERMDGVLKDYKGYPALWGYHVTDEPAPWSFYNITRKNEYIRERDPGKVVFTNLFPYGITMTSAPFFDKGTHQRYVEEFMCLCRPDMLSYDIYVLAKDMKNDNLNGFFNNIEIIRDKALKYNVPINACILSVEHGGYRDPTPEDLRWQIYNTLVYGGKGFIYFTYAHPDYDPMFVYGDALLDKEGKTTHRYYAAQKLNGEVAEMGDLLMSLTSVGVFHTGKPVATMTKPVPAENFIQLEGGDFVLGQFLSESGDMYAMVANRLMRESQTAVLTFAQGVKVSEVKPHCGHGVQTAPNKWQKTLEPGDGVLIKIETGDLKYAKWNYNFKHMPNVAIYAPDGESVKAAEVVRAKLEGKIVVNIIGGDAPDPALLARRLDSEAYIIFGDKDYYLLTGRHEGKRLAGLIDPEAVEDYDAFAGFIGNVYCPAVIVSHRNSEMIAEGLSEFFN
jgi:hypothetical protein